jgi:hypothetical protein
LDDLGGLVLPVGGDDIPDEEAGGRWLGAEQPDNIANSDTEMSNSKRRRRFSAARPAAVDTS